MQLGFLVLLKMFYLSYRIKFKMKLLTQFRWNSSSSLTRVHLKDAEHFSKDTNTISLRTVWQKSKVINSLFFKTTFKHLTRSSKNLEAFPLKLPRENRSLNTKLSLKKTLGVTAHFCGKKIHWDFKLGTQNESVEEQTTWDYMQKQIQEKFKNLQNLCSIFYPVCHQSEISFLK